jgi:hypothetical protein
MHKPESIKMGDVIIVNHDSYKACLRLCQIGKGEFMLIDIETGNRWIDTIYYSTSDFIINTSILSIFKTWFVLDYEEVIKTNYIETLLEKV